MEKGCIHSPEGDGWGCGQQRHQDVFSSFLFFSFKWCIYFHKMVLVARYQNLILCYTFVARIEKVSTLFRYLYVVFWESCPHWFVLQKLAHKGSVSCLSPFGRHGSSKFVLQMSYVWYPRNSAMKDGEFDKYPQNGHFFHYNTSFSSSCKTVCFFCCHLLERGSKIWPHRFHAKRRHNVSSQIARLPTPPGP